MAQAIHDLDALLQFPHQKPSQAAVPERAPEAVPTEPKTGSGCTIANIEDPKLLLKNSSICKNVHTNSTDKFLNDDSPVATNIFPSPLQSTPAYTQSPTIGSLSYAEVVAHGVNNSTPLNDDADFDASSLSANFHKLTLK
jgi:hypothetical protein